MDSFAISKDHSMNYTMETKVQNHLEVPVILCVDDEKMILDSLKIQLKNYFNDECQIELAESGEEALEIIEDLVESGEGFPQVVISDQIMPGMKGDEFLEKVNDMSKDCLKILLTGQADKEHIISAINKARLYRYIAKPWDQMDLNLTVKEALISYMKNKEVEHQRDQLLLLNQSLESKVEERTKELEMEKDKSDKLLHNILPEEVVEELKQKDEVEPKHYDLATIVFIDVVGFTIHSTNLSPNEMVDELNVIFQLIDKIVDKHNLEKIKTIGDGYMFAGGIPIPDEDNPIKVVNACIEIRNEINKLKEEYKNVGAAPWEVRIGVNSGELVAGVIGRQKFAYDVWGHTVNVAARVELKGQPGKINISEATYQLVQDKFKCTPRGKISVKNMGEMKMYFVDHKI